MRKKVVILEDNVSQGQILLKIIGLLIKDVQVVHYQHIKQCQSIDWRTIDAFITDYNIGDQVSVSTATIARATNPNLIIFYMTGAKVSAASLPQHNEFFEKTFSPLELVKKLERYLVEDTQETESVK